MFIKVPAFFFNGFINFMLTGPAGSGKTKIAGVIATNTTISRDGLTSENKVEVGGLSGKPLTKRATEVIRFLSEKSNKSFPIRI